MIVRNIRKDLMYRGIDKGSDNIIMVNNHLNETLDIDHKILYALISNFIVGIDTKHIYELMEPKGWTRDTLENSIKYLISVGFVEEVKTDINLEAMELEFEQLVRSIRKYE